MRKKKSKSRRKPLQKKRANSTVDTTGNESDETQVGRRRPKSRKRKSTGRKIARGLAGLIKRKRGEKKDDSEENTLPVADVELGTSSETEIPEYGEPPRPLRRRKIHKRRKIPRVKKGKNVEDPKPSPRADIKGR